MEEQREQDGRNPQIKTGGMKDVEDEDKAQSMVPDKRSIPQPATASSDTRAAEPEPVKVGNDKAESKTASSEPSDSQNIEKRPEATNETDAEVYLQFFQGYTLPARQLPESQHADDADSQADKWASPHYDQVYQNKVETPPRQSEESDKEMRTSEADQMKQLFDAGKTAIFYTTHSRGNQDVPKTSILNIAALQQMNVHYLQCGIAKIVGRSFNAGTFMPYSDGSSSLYGPDITEWMKKYCRAVRDMDYMRQRATADPREDPFKIMSSKAVERSILESVGLIPGHVMPAGPLPYADDHERPILGNTSRVEARLNEARAQTLRRFMMATAGGLLLLVPVLIMANVPGKLATLVTTSVSMVAFAALVTLATPLGPNEVLATTAGYAAVLIVFVGTSLAPQTGAGR